MHGRGRKGTHLQGEEHVGGRHNRALRHRLDPDGQPATVLLQDVAPAGLVEVVGPHVRADHRAGHGDLGLRHHLPRQDTSVNVNQG